MHQSPTKMRHKSKPILKLAIYVAAFTAVSFIIANQPTAGSCALETLSFQHRFKIPPCPFHSITGLYCPGCGSTRALGYLVHGRLLNSLRYNPLVFPLIPIVTVGIVLNFYEQFTKKGLFPSRFRFEVSVLILSLILLLTLLRNIPMQCLDFIRPPE